MDFEYPEEISKLPIGQSLDSICKELKDSPTRFLVLTAETAAGKSTGVPFALLKHFEGNILMLEPRRLAVLNIASRVATLLHEEPGTTAGYIMHQESKISSKTRFTVLTEAVLNRKLQEDPTLEGVSVVVIDEFHERSIHADLALAFLKEAMELRDDLYVIIMSATIETENLRAFLGKKGNNSVPVPLVTVPGRQFPVEKIYQGNISVTEAIKREIMGTDQYSEGTVLVFLPGIYEIRKVQNELESLGLTDETLPGGKKLELLTLHSSIGIDEQKKIFTPPCPEKRRVILSSSIAETSLTIPDVRIVIDSGLCRTSSYNRNAGMTCLVTRNESVFNEAQRAGRAGRTSSGKCICLWNKNDVRSLESIPEISRSDLTGLVLECYQWGVTDADGLEWLTKPSEASWESARDLLYMLGCIKDGRITALGSACLKMGTDIRVACVALSGLLGDNVELSTGIAAKLDAKSKGTDKKTDFIRKDLVFRVQKLSKINEICTCFPQIKTGFSTGFALLCGYPDRIGVLKDEIYQFPSGRQAIMAKNCTHTPKYIIGTDVDAGEVQGKIRDFEEIDENLALSFMETKICTRTESFFDEETGKLRKIQQKCYYKLVLKEQSVPIQNEDYQEAVIDSINKKGINWLPMSKECRSFLQRVKFYVQNCTACNGDSFYDNLKEKYENLSLTSREWLAPFLPEGQKLNEKAVFDGLFWYLDGDRINREVPEMLILPNGKRRRVQYEENNGNCYPVLEIIIQQIFGCFETPKILGVPVLLRLLSPARRPLQITTDLEHFWTGAWPEICSEMRGRYPKHNWDYRVVEEDK